MHDSVVLSFHCVGKALLETKLRSSGLVALSLWIDPFCLLFFLCTRMMKGECSGCRGSIWKASTGLNQRLKKKKSKNQACWSSKKALLKQWCHFFLYKL